MLHYLAWQEEKKLWETAKTWLTEHFSQRDNRISFISHSAIALFSSLYYYNVLQRSIHTNLISEADMILTLAISLGPILGNTKKITASVQTIFINLGVILSSFYFYSQFEPTKPFVRDQCSLYLNQTFCEQKFFQEDAILMGSIVLPSWGLLTNIILKLIC